MTEAKKTDWLRVIGIAAIVGALVAYGLLMRSCGIKEVMKTVGTQKVVTKDSFIFVDRPVPYRVDVPYIVPGKPIPYIVKEDGVPQIIVEPVDTFAILRDYYSTAYYSDSFAFKRGVLHIADTVSRNRIVGRGRSILWTDTTVNNTTVLVPPKRIVGYFDVKGLGNPSTLGIGGGLSLKLPSDKRYGAGAIFLWKNKPLYYIEAGIPIRLKK